jgi:hypothetical protein
MGKIKTEYWLILALLLVSGLAFPAFVDVNKVQSIVNSICTSVGLG